ncbi:MAG: glycosyltransferase 87 family protein [Terracidiphilus sp.]
MRADLQSATMQRLLPPVEVSVLILLAALFLFRALVPAWGTLRSDFPNYYLIARMLREHYSMDRIYDWIWLQRIKDHWSIPVSLVGFPGATPFSALPVLPLTWMDALNAKRVWLLENLVIFITSLYGMQKITGVNFRRVALIAFLAIIPLCNNFLLGQMHVLVLGLLVFAYWLNERNQWFSCGLILAVAAALKVYPLFFVFFFLRKRQWKTAAALTASTLAILAACFFIFGAPVMRAFLIEQLPRAMRGEAVDPFSLTGPSASSLFHRIFLPQPQMNPHPLYSSPLLYALFYPPWQLSLLGATLLTISPEQNDPRRRSLEWAVWICLLLTLSTLPASYHFVVLIFVVVLAINAMQSAWRRAALLVCFVAACDLHPFVAPDYLVLALFVDFVRYWGLLGMMGCLLFELRAYSLQPLASQRACTRASAAMTLAGFAILWCVAAATTYAHVRSIADSEYLANPVDGSFARFAPHWTGSHLLTVAMSDQGYRVKDEVGQHYPTGIYGTDEEQLAIASNPLINRVWIEAESGGRSRLVELTIPSNAAAAAPIATVLDAESPALSPDGHRLVFLREVHGIGRAWMVHLDDNGRVMDAPRPVSPEGMNISSASLGASGEIYFSAAEDGVSHLFVTTDSGETPRRIYARSEAMDSPAANAESGQLIYRKRSRGYWHLFAASLARGDVTQLTFGDCNAYDPAWSDAATLLYISDCGRGMGLGAVAISHPSIVAPELANSLTSATLTHRLQGEAQR